MYLSWRKNMVIAYQSSESFSKICMVSLYSLLINNRNDMNLRVYILSKDFSQDSLHKIKGLMSKLGFNPGNAKVIDINNLSQRFNLVFDDYNGKWGVDSFCKILLGKLLPEDEERVLYLDSDTIVTQDLSELYNINLGDCDAAAVKDFLSKRYYDFLNLSDDSVYVNSGVLLIDLNNWRRDKIDEKVSAFLQEKRGMVFFSEQSVLNIVCEGQIKELDLKYNLTSIPATLSISEIKDLRSPIKNLDFKQLEQARKNPVIIHFTSLFLICGRAWNIECNHPYKHLFDEYSKHIDEFEETHVSNNEQKLNALIKMAPRKWLCKIVGYYYNEIRIEKYKKYCRKRIVNNES